MKESHARVLCPRKSDTWFLLYSIEFPRIFLDYEIRLDLIPNLASLHFHQLITTIMNYERMADEIPEIFQTTENSKGMVFHEFAIASTAESNSELNFLFGLLGWARNEAFEKVADTCALWSALVHANAHLASLESEISCISFLCTLLTPSFRSPDGPEYRP